MEAIVFCGIQGSGKSTFFRERFFPTHVRLNLDMLHTRNREDILLHACLAAQQPFVVDNTNPLRAQRTRYARLASAAGFTPILYYFPSDTDAALTRNRLRPAPYQVPDVAIRGTAAKLQLPTPDEGFARAYRVRVAEDNTFITEEWSYEV